MLTRHYATRGNIVLFRLSIGLFVSCLLFPAIDETDGLFMLLFGWVTIPETLANFAWLANPILLVTWILMRHKRWTLALVSSGVAAVLVLLPLFSRNAMTNEGGVILPIFSLRTGYWLWVSSAYASVIASVVGLIGRSRPEQSASTPLV